MASREPLEARGARLGLWGFASSVSGRAGSSRSLHRHDSRWLQSSDLRAEAIQLLIEYDPQPPYDSGHTLKARPAVRTLAEREMLKASLTARESWALMRLVGRSFVSSARKKLPFRIETNRNS